MTRQRLGSRGPFESLDERLKACPSWVRQRFEHLDRTCRRISPGAKTKDAARYEGRVFCIGPKQRSFCRIDPNSKRIGVRFSNAIRDLVKAKRMLRNREGGAWIYVDENTDLTTVVALIEKSWTAVKSA
jgi:hypothetical protein